MQASQSGRWEGIWTTYDDQGLEQMAHEGVWDVQLVPDDKATHALEVPGPGGGARSIPVGTRVRRADVSPMNRGGAAAATWIVRGDDVAATWIVRGDDVAATTTWIVRGGTWWLHRYERGALGRQTCAGAGMVCGPSLLRSGLVSTELLLRHGASRLRVTVQHAPAEGKDASAEPALLCYRCVVARERCDAALGAPTREVEQQRWADVETPADGDDTHFWRGQSPWAWRRTWKGEAAVVTGCVVQEAGRPNGWLSHRRRAAASSRATHSTMA